MFSKGRHCLVAGCSRDKTQTKRMLQKACSELLLIFIMRPKNVEPPPPIILHRWGWRRLATTLQNMSSLHELDHQGTVFFARSVFWRSITAGGRVCSFVRGGERLLRTRGMIKPRSG